VALEFELAGQVRAGGQMIRLSGHVGQCEFGERWLKSAESQPRVGGVGERVHRFKVAFPAGELLEIPFDQAGGVVPWGGGLVKDAVRSGEAQADEISIPGLLARDAVVAAQEEAQPGRQIKGFGAESAAQAFAERVA
jgi:hypothetical protein